ncbi:hypothetical protein MLD38_012492 [Melastoma candidum]|uniref:Uncharacterized protein n=1 Tax=Melastoma candidum TaxID=119954 RepID=A0ACB9R5Y7_9MYRT|nr:hypothetical protein MLD38_012492 [Melastoma candidum]
MSMELTEGPIVVVVAMKKGHCCCSGETTLAMEMARSLHLHGYHSLLLTYHHLRSSIWEIPGSSSSPDAGPCDDTLYRILCRVASTHLRRGHEARTRAIVLDLPLHCRGHLDQVLNLRRISRKPFLFVAERRGPPPSSSTSAALDVPEPSSPPVEDIQYEISGHRDYCVDGFLYISIDTTDSSKSTRDHAEDVISRMSSCYQKPAEPEPILTTEAVGPDQQPSRTHFSHDHPLFYYPEHVVSPENEEAASICTLCREAPSGPVYGCSRCGFYLHESCAQLPYAIKFGRAEFVLGPTIGEEIFQSRECLVCYGQSGVLYNYDITAFDIDLKCRIHRECAGLPYKLKHSCHEHHLKLTMTAEVFTCGACGTYGIVTAYYCEVCDFYFHVMCTLYLEARVVHERHCHPFVLCTIPRDETDEYYCEICVTERHPDLWAYYCKPCEYEAHISCMNKQIKPCNPEVLLPEYRAEGQLSSLRKWIWDSPNVRNPILSNISGSKIAWEPVDDDGDEEKELLNSRSDPEEE